MLNEKEKKEWLTLSTSMSLKKDMRNLKANRHNPFLKEGKVDVDAVMEFLTSTNEFFNHCQKPFKPMIEKVMKL